VGGAGVVEPEPEPENALDPDASGCGYAYGVYPGFGVLLLTKSTSPFGCGVLLM
jgi:hypothetical protein